MSNAGPADRVNRFNMAVEGFLRKHSLAAVADIIRKDLEKAFFADPAIGAYLTRTAQDLRFDEKGEPILDSEYERQFYDACRSDSKTYIPYRAQEGLILRRRVEGDHVVGYTEKTQAFYDSGTDVKTTAIMNRMLHKNTRTTGGENGPAHVYLVTNSPDTYQTSGLLRRIQGESPRYDSLKGIMQDALGREITLPDTGVSFLVFPSGRDAHAITFFAVIDNATKKVIRTGLCNSWANEEYARQVRHRMNMDVDPEHEPDIKPFSMLDCSHHIQKSAGDYNCGLYRYHFARALVEMLKQDEHIQKLLSNPKASEQTVIHSVIEGMKAHLPEYYKATQNGFVEASEDEKKRVNLETRWEAGNAFIREKIAEFRQAGRERTA